MFSSKLVLLDEAQKLAASLGFHVRLDGLGVFCTRAGKTKTVRSRQDSTSGTKRKRNPNNILKCGCKFYMRFEFVVPSFAVEGEFGLQRGDRYRTSPELEAVRLNNNQSFLHTGGCCPCYQQFVMQSRKAGTSYIKQSEMMNELLSVMQLSDKNLDASTLRAHLKKLNPTQKFFTADEIRNFRLWALRKIASMKDSGEGVVLSGKDLKEMFHDVIAKPGVSVAVDDAEDLYRSVLKDALGTNQNTWKCDKYLKTLRANDACFDYRIATDTETGAATALVWQTGAMRADFELYGCALFCDSMKRKMNAYNWPYISCVVIDGSGSPRCAIEGICCSERTEAYTFAVKALLDMSPGRTRMDVLALFSDCILSETIVHAEQMNLPNCHFFWDHHHLIDDVWPKAFGPLWGGWLTTNLEGMLNADSLEAFEKHYSNLKTLFAGKVTIMDKIDAIAGNRHLYAKYVIKSCEGTLGRVGSAPAEQNHSSIVAHLGGAIYEDPAVEIKKLLVRQRNLLSKRNEDLAIYHFQIPADIAKSAKIRNDPELLAAKRALGQVSFKLWEQQQQLSKLYTVSVDGTTGTRTYTNRNHSKERSVPAGNRCNCAERVQHLFQCRHEIAENEGRFCPQLIDKRHFFHSSVHATVQRNSSICGAIPSCPGTDDVVLVSNSSNNDDEAIGSSNDDDEAIGNSSNDDDDAVDNSTNEETTSFVANGDEFGNTDQQKRPKCSYSDLMRVFSEIATKAINHGVGHVVMGAAIQINQILTTGGSVVAGSLEKIIHTFQQTFGSRDTGSVNFSLSCPDDTDRDPQGQEVLAPAKPPSLPGSRTAETRLMSGRERAKRANAIKGKPKTSTCGFCRQPGHHSPGCTKKNQYGQVFTDADTLATILTKTATQADKTAFQRWPMAGQYGGRTILYDAAPSKAKHIVISGVYSIDSAAGNILAADVTFLADGGEPLEGYCNVPMSLETVVKSIHKKFYQSGKFIIIPDDVKASIVCGHC